MDEAIHRILQCEGGFSIFHRLMVPVVEPDVTLVLFAEAPVEEEDKEVLLETQALTHIENVLCSSLNFRAYSETLLQS